MPTIVEYPRYAGQLLRGERAAGERSQLADLLRDVGPLLDMSAPRRILDLANGRLRPQYTLLKQRGHHVVGVDLANQPRRTATDIAYVLARRLYRWRVGAQGEPIGRQTLVCGDVGLLPFPDESFDLVVSAAAFEHFLDVPAVLADLYRVLRPGGAAWVAVHLFACPSGGHNVSFTEYPLQHLPPGVEPWDHLRGRQLPFSVPLNEWRREQYVAEFARHFEVLQVYCRTREGEQWLTPALEAELSDYTRDELTCAQLVIVARKRG
jgi:SAM-dependent methyltransferase